MRGRAAGELRFAEYLNPALRRDCSHAGVEQIGYTAFWFAVLQIIFVNILLSGDNAVVIAMACRGLPRRQRRWGMAIGAGVAVLLRIIFAGVDRLADAAALSQADRRRRAALHRRQAARARATRATKSRRSAHLWRAVMIVVVADIVMSFDNIVAVAAIAKGDLVLLAIGLAVSIPLIVAGAALITALLDRFPILIWAGAALLGWVAGETIVGDPAIVGAI